MSDKREEFLKRASELHPVPAGARKIDTIRDDYTGSVVALYQTVFEAFIRPLLDELDEHKKMIDTALQCTEKLATDRDKLEMRVSCLTRDVLNLQALSHQDSNRCPRCNRETIVFFGEVCKQCWQDMRKTDTSFKANFEDLEKDLSPEMVETIKRRCSEMVEAETARLEEAEAKISQLKDTIGIIDAERRYSLDRCPANTSKT